MATVESLFRYPVKGLSPEPLDHIAFEGGAYVPGDRLYAIENGPSGYEAASPVHLPKTKFLMLMRNERLARLRTAYDTATCRITVDLDGVRACEADLETEAGRRSLEAFLADFCAADLAGPPRLLSAAEGFRFTDSRKGFVSLVNLASVRDVEREVGRPVDPLRFRANVYIEDLPAWDENHLIGRFLQIGAARLEVVATTERCAATSVDPATGKRDMNLVKTLLQRFGHNLCGVYARVTQGGMVRPGDRITLAG